MTLPFSSQHAALEEPREYGRRRHQADHVKAEGYIEAHRPARLFRAFASVWINSDSALENSIESPLVIPRMWV
jgi:hypothetical protein